MKIGKFCHSATSVLVVRCRAFSCVQSSRPLVHWREAAYPYMLKKKKYNTAIRILVSVRGYMVIKIIIHPYIIRKCNSVRTDACSLSYYALDFSIPLYAYIIQISMSFYFLQSLAFYALFISLYQI